MAAKWDDADSMLVELNTECEELLNGLRKEIESLGADGMMNQIKNDLKKCGLTVCDLSDDDDDDDDVLQ